MDCWTAAVLIAQVPGTRRPLVSSVIQCRYSTCELRTKCCCYLSKCSSALLLMFSRSCGSAGVTLGNPSGLFSCAATVRGWMWSLANTGSPSAQIVKVSTSTHLHYCLCASHGEVWTYSGTFLPASAGRYVRSNLNMPPSLPLWGGQRDYDMDAPITVFGSTQARLVGT